MTPQTERPPTWTERLRAAPVTTFFFAVCVLVFVLAERSGSTEETATLLRFGATWRERVWAGEPWRLFTSMFLHIGVVHLVWNLWAGFSWSAPFERLVGPWRFALIYLLSGLVGSAASVIGHDAVSAGASGALFGVMGGMMVLYRRALGGWREVWAQPGLRQNIVMTALWLVLGPFMRFDSFAHGGGMVAGAALTWVLLPPRRGPIVATLVACALFIGAALRPWPLLHGDWAHERDVFAAVDRRDWPAVLEGTTTGPLSPRLAAARAQALVFSSRANEALALLPDVEGLGVGTQRVRAMVLLEAGRDDAALKECEQGLAVAEDDPYLLRLRTLALLAKGDGPAAATTAEKLLALRPSSAEVMLLRAETLAQTHRLAEAFELAKAAEQAGAAGQFTPARLRLGLFAGHRDEVAQAVREPGLSAEDRAALTCLLALTEGAFADASEVCTEPESQATAAVGQGECGKARELIAEAAKTRTTRGQQFLLGLCALRDGDVGEAERQVEAMSKGDATAVEVTLLKRELAKVQGAAPVELGAYEQEARDSGWWPLVSK